jgi:hypothetical protein
VHDAYPSNVSYNIRVRRDGVSATSQARVSTDFNGGFVHESYTKAGVPTHLTFSTSISNENIVLKVAEGPKQESLFLLFTIPKWSGATPTFYHERKGQWRGEGQAPPQAATKAAFDAATASTYFVDDSLIYVKMQTTDTMFNINGYNYTYQEPVNPQALYNQWLGSVFTQAQLNDPAYTSPSGDPQKDGVPNGIEYVLATGPGLADKPPTTISKFVTSSGTRPQISFRRVHPFREGTSMVVEQTTDLVNWTPIATAAAGASTWTGTGIVWEEAAVNGRVLTTVASPTKIEPATPKVFLRLRTIMPQ